MYELVCLSNFFILWSIQASTSIMDRFGLFSLIIIGANNVGVTGTAQNFPEEKAIMSGKMAARMYRIGPYFIAKALSGISIWSIQCCIWLNCVPLGPFTKGPIQEVSRLDYSSVDR